MAGLPCISPPLLGRAALRIGARDAGTDLGLALAALGLVVAGLRHAPATVTLPTVADLAASLLPDQRPHAGAILCAAAGIVEWLASQEDARLAAAPIAGSA